MFARSPMCLFNSIRFGMLVGAIIGHNLGQRIILDCTKIPQYYDDLLLQYAFHEKDEVNRWCLDYIYPIRGAVIGGILGYAMEKCL